MEVTTIRIEFTCNHMDTRKFLSDKDITAKTMPLSIIGKLYAKKIIINPLLRSIKINKFLIIKGLNLKNNSVKCRTIFLF